MFKFLGKGWKTVTGATLWAVAHTGVITAVVGLVNPAAAGKVTDLVTHVGAALAVLGIAHKAERLDPGTGGGADDIVFIKGGGVGKAIGS